MNSELITQGLMIAAIGMGLVFVVIIFLWGLMALLMRLTSGGETPTAADRVQGTLDSGLASDFERTEHQRRAAAAAVAVGLALADLTGKAEGFRAGENQKTSPWQVFHRSRGIHPEKRRG